MAINSKQKGSRGERTVRDYLRGLGFADARRTAQYCGKAGDSDIVCPETLPNLHLEVKFGYPIETFDLSNNGISNAVQQCITDCKPGQTWVILWKPKHHRSVRLTYSDADTGCLCTVCGDRDIKHTLERLNGDTQ